LLPVTVNVKLGPPAVTDGGLMLVIVGGACALATAHIPAKKTSKAGNTRAVRREGQFMEPLVDTNMG
jgi:hypothetical protein